jgi:DNA invertase Pin-like site-specific DNA recombinase
VHFRYTEVMINGYARVSTAEQSLDRQMDELKVSGAERIYKEVGSGKKGADRPEWDELLRSLRKGDTVMVTELSRLGRSTSQLSALADDLKDRGISLRILNLGIDTGTPSGRLVYSIIAAVAEMERELLIERTVSGLAASRARGRKGGRRREFSPAAARKAQERYDAGDLSVTEIARLAGVSRQTLYRYLKVANDRDPVPVK